MELANGIDKLRAQKRWLVVGVAIAALIAIAATGRLSLNPPGLKSAPAATGAATAQFYVDSNRSAISNVVSDTAELAARAQIVAQFIGTAQVRREIGRQMGVPANTINVTAQPNSVQDPANAAPVVNASSAPSRGYSITYQTQLQLPVIDVYTQGPDPASAARLANSTVGALQVYMRQLAKTNSVALADPQRVVVRQTGVAVGVAVTNQSNLMKSVGIGLVVFVLWCGILLLRGRRPEKAAAEDSRPETAGDELPEPVAVRPSDTSGQFHGARTRTAR